MTHIHDIACPCCGKNLRIREEHLDRIARAAAFLYGGRDVAIDIGALPDIDWTAADVDDALIGRAVVQACAPDGGNQ